MGVLVARTDWEEVKTRVLASLAKDPKSVKDLSQLLFVGAAGIKKTLEELEAEGLVYSEIESRPRDGRRVFSPIKKPDRTVYKLR